MGFVEDKRFKEFGAKCVFFNRHGGVSLKPFDSLNFSTSSGDSVESIKKNLDIAKNLLHAREIGTISQIHFNKIVKYESGTEKEADGIYTRELGIFIAIKFADCLPLALMDTKKKIIMVIHAGWRGTYLNISKKAVERFKDLGSNIENIIVTIGPHICKKCYEIKEDVAKKFDEKYLNIKDGKIYLDLSAANKRQLVEMGVPEKNIKDLNICTFENRDFFSYRRDKVCGRNLGGLMLIDNTRK